MIHFLRNKFSHLKAYVLPHSSFNGFTLVELLIVIGVLGLLASTLIILINPVAQLQKSRDAQRKSDLRQIQSALEMYRSDNQGYPLTAAFPACGSSLTGGGVTYMTKVPCDPKGASYFYTSTINTAYVLQACLERVNDPDPLKDPTNKIPPCNSSTWSYTVQNP